MDNSLHKWEHVTTDDPRSTLHRIRVNSGWIYRVIKDINITLVFVPFSAAEEKIYNG